MHLPLRRRGQPVHRVGGGSTGPQHIRGIQDDAERTADIGTNLQSGGDRLGLLTGREHLGHCRRLETIQ